MCVWDMAYMNDCKTLLHNESRHKGEIVMSHICMCHVTYFYVTLLKYANINIMSHMNKSFHKND